MNDVTQESAEKFVKDLQVAHRLVVAYYQRLVANLDGMAKDLDLDFWYWEPLETSPPCRTSTQPSRKWMWDMVPLYASTHIYKRSSAKKLKKGDLAVGFDIYVDDAFESGNRRRAKFPGDADPLKLPMGEGSVTVEMYRCNQDLRVGWDDAWNEAESPKIDIKKWQDVGGGLHAQSFSVSLADFLRQPELVGDKLRGMAAADIQ